MRIGALRLRRAALAAAGIAAGALAGCQTPGTQYMHTGVARGDMVPASPALARVSAGQQFAKCSSSGMTTTTVVPDPTMTANASSSVVPMQAVIAGPGISGSGGMVYPVNYAPVPSQSMTSGQIVMQQPVMMPAPQQPMVQMQPQTMPVPQAMPTPTGQQTLLLVNGPNGPQYIIAEVIGQVQTQPATVMTAPTAYVPATPPQAMTMPASAPAPAHSPTPDVVAPPAPAFATAPVTPPTPAPAPAAPPVVAPAAVTPTSAPPTFNPPPPAAVPMPAIPPLPPSSETSLKAPAPLPSTLNSTASAGPVLPAPDPAMPTLASYPVPPVKNSGPGPKLPQPTGGATDDDIPAAPVFVPAPR
jgi:hypothetical protein